jgi:hypothetical protein
MRASIKSRFIAETQKKLREFSYDPIGRQRSDHKPSPFGDTFRIAFHNGGLRILHVLTWKRAFYLAASEFEFPIPAEWVYSSKSSERIHLSLVLIILKVTLQ